MKISVISWRSVLFVDEIGELKINDSTFYISNIYPPNNGKERKSFFNAINDTLFKYTDDSDKNYSLILDDFNCAIQKNLDRNPPQQLDDISVREF